jgi:hypothetical protein
MSLMTPLLHAKGVYEVSAPWTIAPGIIYECIAIRSFVDLQKLGEDVFDLYYNPQGLDQIRYETDRILNANIITLISPTHPTIYVPDTFITKYPELNGVKYNRLVLSIDLGPLPDYEDLTFLKNQLQGVVSDVIGVVAEVKVHIAPSTGVVSQSDHTAAQNARQAAITARDTDYAKLLETESLVTDLRTQLTSYEAVFKEKILPP